MSRAEPNRPLGAAAERAVCKGGRASQEVVTVIPSPELT